MSLKYRGQKYDIVPEVEVPFKFLDLISGRGNINEYLLVLGLDVSKSRNDVYAVALPVSDKTLEQFSTSLFMGTLSDKETEAMLQEFLHEHEIEGKPNEPFDFRVSSTGKTLMTGLTIIKNCSDMFGYKDVDKILFEKLKGLMINE